MIQIGLLYNYKNMSYLPWLNVTQVRSIDDFPAAVAGVITLPTGTYSLQAVIVTWNRFVIPDGAVVQLRGLDAFIGWIVYTWTWDMFTFSDILSLSFTETFMTCPTASKLYNVTNATLSLAQIFIINTAIFDVADWWSIEKVTQFTWYFNAFTDIGNWIVLDWVDIISFNQINVDLWKDNTTSMFTVDWTTTSFNMSNVTFWTKTNETVFDFKSTLVVWAATIVWCTYDQTWWWDLFAAWSKDQTDVNLNFSANSNMPRSIVFGNMNISSTETVAIASTWVPVVVNDTTTSGTNIWTELWNTSRFTFDSSLGRFTYTGIEDIVLNVITSSSVQKSWGWADIISTLIAKNGTAIAESISTAQSSTPTSLVSIADVSLVTWDFIELMVQNDSTTTSIDIDVSNFIARG